MSYIDIDMENGLSLSGTSDLKPIEYTKDADKMHATIVTPASNVPVHLAKKVKNYAKIIFDLMDAIPQPARVFAVYQCYHETGGFTSELLLQHNNASGIKYAGQKGAVRGNNGYAWFNSLQDWANSMIHELTKGSNPAGAKTLEDYVNRLKQNKYFEDTVSNYLRGLKFAQTILVQFASSPTDSASQAQNIETLQNNYGILKTENWFEKLSLLEKAGIILGALLVAKKVLD